MAEHEKFHYRSLSELTSAAQSLGLDLPTDDDVSILTEPVCFGRLEAPNRLAVHPMEGCDGTAEGAPGELTFRRYERFAAGGAGLIWFEATAVAPEGRANPRQLHIHDGTVEAFAELARRTRAAAAEAGLPGPVLVLQLTHSGRYSKPTGRPEPIIAHHSPILDPVHGLGLDYPLISDEQLDALQDAYVRAAELAAGAGFDAVDVKSCHRYLISELLASHTRQGSRYGGDYAGRTRLLRETMAKIRAAAGERVELACRMNVYDGFAHPYGWGVAAEPPGDAAPRPDMSEPIRLAGELAAAGLVLLSVTAGNPYYIPHVTRPADWATAGARPVKEHPLEGVARLTDLTRQMQQAMPDLTVLGAGYSWLRQYFPHFAAARVARGHVKVVGLGRGALAYPSFARELAAGTALDPRKVCVLCGSCSQIMIDGGRAGCVIHDSEVYGPIFRAGRRRARDTLRALADECRRCVEPPCREACPAGVDVPAFLEAVAGDDFRGAYRTVRESILLAGACGAVCPSEVTCRDGCVRAVLGQSPVPVGEIHRHVAALAVERGWAALELPDACSGHQVAVIGAGPAGLACAAPLLEAGHRVAVFDRASEPGGKLASVIPTWRLPRAELRAEIDAIFGRVDPDRLTWRLGEALGPERTLDDVLAEGFDAACLAMGLGSAPALGGGAPEGVIEAGAFLAQLNANPSHRVAGDVAVIGGGNTAADAAAMAKARGAAEVYLLYRRGYEQMPAWPAQRQEALEAGVHLLLLAQAVGYEADQAGGLAGVRVVRTRLGEGDATGRRRPVEIPDSEYVLPAALAVEALGEGPGSPDALADVLRGVRLDGGTVSVEPDTLATTRDGVFAAGDLVNGGTTVARALAEGRRAAEGIHNFLNRRVQR